MPSFKYLNGTNTIGTGTYKFKHINYEAPATNTYLTFSSPTSFTIAKHADATNDGTVQYSTDKTTWNTFTTTAVTSVLTNSNYEVYFRGIGNTYVRGGGSGYYTTSGYFLINGANVYCSGNIETLLDYATVDAGNHPTMASSCFGYIFSQCAGLISPPEFPAVTLSTAAYGGAFSGCVSLTTLPMLPALTLTDTCYDSMFEQCLNIKMSSTQTTEYTNPYVIPSIGTGTVGPNSLYNMFTSTGGTFTGTPTINKTYYQKPTVVETGGIPVTLNFTDDGYFINSLILIYSDSEHSKLIGGCNSHFTGTILTPTGNLYLSPYRTRTDYDFNFNSATCSDSNVVVTVSNDSMSFVGITSSCTCSISCHTSCLVKGTKITLADYTTKNVEDITYEDNLLVWDFDNACLSTAKPLWIMKKATTGAYNLLTFEDGSTLGTVNQHRIFNKEKGMFTYPMTDDTPIGTTTYSLNGYIKLTDKVVVQKSTDYYNIITDYHVNLFANGILTSCRYSNIYPIKDMAYVKDNRTLKPISAYNVSDKYYKGLRLSEQPIDIESTNKYVKRLEDVKI